MTMKQLFVTDLDGTFLRSDHSFDKQALRSILDQFKQRGYLFVAASGRSLRSLENLFQDFDQDMAFIAENGSLVSYQGQMIFEDKPIQPAVYLSLIEELDQGPYGSRHRVLLSGREGAFVLESADEAFHQNVSDYYPNVQSVQDFSQVSEDIVKLVMTFPEEELEAANRWLNQEFEGISAVTTGFDSVDIILSDIHKAVGLSHLCQHFGVTEDQVIAFGDNQNDLEMLAFAGLALATENARPAVLDIADQIIGHCNDDAVIRYLEAYLEGK